MCVSVCACLRMCTRVFVFVCVVCVWAYVCVCAAEQMILELPLGGSRGLVSVCRSGTSLNNCMVYYLELLLVGSRGLVSVCRSGTALNNNTVLNQAGDNKRITLIVDISPLIMILFTVCIPHLNHYESAHILLFFLALSFSLALYFSISLFLSLNLSLSL
jgi:hypothetical protein